MQRSRSRGSRVGLAQLRRKRMATTEQKNPMPLPRWLHQLVYPRKQHLRTLYALGPPCALLLTLSMLLLLARELLVSTRILTQSAIVTDALPAPDAGLLGTHATLLLPGVTVGWTVLPALLAATALAVFVHEMGHVMAAMVEGIPVLSVGITTVYYVLPAAHVTLDTSALAAATPTRRTRVAAAGMLHNVLLTLLCALLSLAAHRMLAVGGVAPMSDLAPHLPLGGLITGVGICPVHGLGDWPACVQHTAQDRAAFGFCLPRTTIRHSSVCLPDPAAVLGDGPLAPIQGCSPSQLCAVPTNATDPHPPMGWCNQPEQLLRMPRCTLHPQQQQAHQHPHRTSPPPPPPPGSGAMLCGNHAVCVRPVLPRGIALLNVYFTEPADRAAVASIDPSHALGGAMWGSSMAGRLQRGRPTMGAVWERSDWTVGWPPGPPKKRPQPFPGDYQHVVDYYDVPAQRQQLVLDAAAGDAVIGAARKEAWTVEPALPSKAVGDAAFVVQPAVPVPLQSQATLRRPRRLLARPLHLDADEYDDDHHTQYGWQAFRVAADEDDEWHTVSKSLAGLHPLPTRATGAHGSRSEAAAMQPPTWWQLAAQQRARQQEALRKALRGVKQASVVVAAAPASLLRSVVVDEWEPLGPGLPEWLPWALLGSLTLVSRVSMALALVNALPIAGLDGHVLMQVVWAGGRARRVASLGSAVLLAAVVALHVIRILRAYARMLVPT